jgi:hypothetical protein
VLKQYIWYHRINVPYTVRPLVLTRISPLPPIATTVYNVSVNNWTDYCLPLIYQSFFKLIIVKTCHCLVHLSFWEFQEKTYNLWFWPEHAHICLDRVKFGLNVILPRFLQSNWDYRSIECLKKCCFTHKLTWSVHQ